MIASVVLEGICATAAEWRKLRDAARAAAKANEYDLALQQYQLAYQEAADAFKGTDTRFLETVAEAAHFQVQFRRFDEAISMYQSALERMPKARGGEQAFKASFMVEIGKAQMYARQLDRAEESFKNAVEYAEAKLDRSPQHADALEGLASVFIERGQPDQALPLLKRALHIATNASRGYAYYDGVQLQQRNTPTTSEYSIQNTIGILHLSQSNFVEAEKAFRDALSTVNRQRANTMVNYIKANTASLERNLAQAYRGQAEYRQAEDALIRSIAISENLEGSGVAIAQAVALLASIHFEQNDAELARLLGRLASKKSKDLQVARFPAYVEMMARQYSLHDWARTAHLLEKARETAPQFAAQLSRLGGNLASELKQVESAKSFLRECVSDLQKAEGSESANLLSPLKDLAELEHATGNNEVAAKLFAQSASIARRTFGERDTRLANVMDDQASFLEKTGQAAEARSVRAEANKIRAAALQR